MTSTHYYLVVISFALGIFVATLAGFSLPTLVWLMLLALVFVALYRRTKDTGYPRAFLFCGLFLAFFVLGALRLEVAMENFGHSSLENMVGDQVELEGIVAREPELRETANYLYLQTDEDLVLVSAERYQKVSYGDEVVVSGKLSQPESFTTDLGRTFNYPGHLLAKGVEYKITFATVEVKQSGKGNFIIAKLLNFKSAFLENISSLLAEPAAGLGAGLLLGVKQALGEDLESAFRETGIIHIVVLSGYNVMLVVVFVMYLLGYFLPLRPRVVIGLVAILTFALLVGLSATVLRACIMAAILLVAQFFGRSYLVLRGILLTGIGMLLFNPLLLVYDVGFQLSFLATLGLILITPHLEQWFKLVPGTIGLRGFLIATISTQIAVMPLLLYQIGQFSVVSVVVNVLVLPMVPVAMLLTFITGLTAFLSTSIASLLAIPAYFSLSYINLIALWFAELPFASFVIPTFSFYFVLIAYAIIGYLLFRYYDPTRKLSYAEMGEALLKDSKYDKANRLVKDWQIEEESEIGPVEFNKTKVTEKDQPKRPKESTSDSSGPDAPIFFR